MRVTLSRDKEVRERMRGEGGKKREREREEGERWGGGEEIEAFLI